MKGFYRQKGEGIKGRADDLIFLWAMEKVYVADYLIDADQKIPN